MQQNIRLSKCGALVAQLRKSEDYIVVMARILTQGEYIDMNGTKVIVNEEVLTKLVANYNARVEEEFMKHQQLIAENADQLDPTLVSQVQGVPIIDFDLLPNQIDHNIATVKATVGNVMGKMELKQSMGKLAIFANLKVKGAENVACVADNRWRNLSVQYNPETYEWIEVSWVIYGADPDANKVMSASTFKTKERAAINEETYQLIDACNKTIYKLERKLFIDKKILGLCKLRKITKADAYFIEKELNVIQDLSSLNSVFNILDKQLSSPKKEKFIAVPENVMRDLHNTLQGVSNVTTYEKSKPLRR